MHRSIVRSRKHDSTISHSFYWRKITRLYLYRSRHHFHNSCIFAVNLFIDDRGRVRSTIQGGFCVPWIRSSAWRLTRGQSSELRNSPQAARALQRCREAYFSIGRSLHICGLWSLDIAKWYTQLEHSPTIHQSERFPDQPPTSTNDTVADPQTSISNHSRTLPPFRPSIPITIPLLYLVIVPSTTLHQPTRDRSKTIPSIATHSLITRNHSLRRVVFKKMPVWKIFSRSTTTFNRAWRVGRTKGGTAWRQRERASTVCTAR